MAWAAETMLLAICQTARTYVLFFTMCCATATILPRPAIVNVGTHSFAGQFVNGRKKTAKRRFFCWADDVQNV